MSNKQLFKQLNTSNQGLRTTEAQKRIQEFGYNEIEVKKKSVLLSFLSHFWGPIPFMIEIAAILSFIRQDWMEFSIIMFLLIFNSMVGFIQEYQAGNAIEELKKKLARKCRVLRDGTWQIIEAKELVPGDIVRLRLGDIVPADIKLIEDGWLSIDQSALTGESLPVTKKDGEIAFSGSIVKQGEMLGLVTATGKTTYFGKTTMLVAKAKKVSHFQKAVLHIGTYLIYISFALVAILIVVQLERKDSFMKLAQFVLILVVASIPVAMPAVLSVTMAKGALMLARLKAIVTRLETIEEMAGITVLCSDKTGTLTQNMLTLMQPAVFGNTAEDRLILFAGLASKQESHDSIDDAILNGIKDTSLLANYKQLEFTPFDPVHKRTEAKIQDTEGNIFYTTKGAPQVIMKMCGEDGLEQAKTDIEKFAKKGYRTLGVAVSKDKANWEFLGLLPLADPLREDSISTVQKAIDHGVDVKMITGDNYAIAREIADELNLKKEIIPAKKAFPDDAKAVFSPPDWDKISGFCEVYPEHKFDIVKAFQKEDHIVGMTGDGVNDAPALKQADVGIAVSGATDAARSAASLVLTAPGLSVIINAIDEARCIFERMNSYAIYRITETIRIMFFIVATILIYNFYPLNAIMVTLLAVLNDIPILTIAYDNTITAKGPVRWQMRRVLTLASSLGFVGIIETLGLLIIAKSYFHVALEELQTIIFLKLIVAGHLTLFVARARSWFFTPPYPSIILFSAILGTQAIAALIAVFGVFITPISWSIVGFIWLYCLVWIFIEDAMKIMVYRHLDHGHKRHRHFLQTVKQRIG